MSIYCKKIGANLCLGLFLFLISFLTIDISVYAETEKQYVHDKASLFSTEEIESLESTASVISEEYNTSIYILTDVNSQGLSRKTYMQNFADAEMVTNSTILFINIDPDNRGVEIQGYGEDEYRISNPRVESILDYIRSYLTDGQYYVAATVFLEETEYYLKTDPDIYSDSSVSSDSNYADSDKYYRKEQRKEAVENSIFSNIIVQILISCGIAGIAVFIMAYNSGGRNTVNERTYLDSNRSRVVGRRDQYIRTNTTRVRKPQNNSSSGGGSHGGGGGGVSSGGRSHSGGGRSF